MGGEGSLRRTIGILKFQKLQVEPPINKHGRVTKVRYENSHFFFKKLSGISRNGKQPLKLQDVLRDHDCNAMHSSNTFFKG